MKTFSTVLTILSIVLFFSLLSLSASAQEKWMDILQKSKTYYLGKQEGQAELFGLYKNVLKVDTSSFYKTFLYTKTGGKIARLSYDSQDGFNVYIKDSTFFINTVTSTYFIGLKNRESDLSFLPHWNTNDFFNRLTGFGILHKPEVTFDAGQKQYLLTLKSKNQGYELVVDANNFEIKKFVETIRHKKYGVQYTAYFFQKNLFQPQNNMIRNSLDSIRSNFTFITEESTNKLAIQNDRKRDSLIHTKIDRSLLNDLLSGQDSTLRKDNYILLDFFYETCLPCLKALGDLKELHINFTGKPLSIVGIDAIKADEGHMPGFVTRHQIPYKLIDAQPARQIQKLVLPGLFFGYPTLVLIAPDGTIEKIYEGYSKGYFKDLRGFLEKVL